MSAERLYHGRLMEHYHSPRNHGDLRGLEVVSRVNNALCGDALEAGIRVREGRLTAVRYRARGCAICVASGSLMTEVVAGASVEDARSIRRTLEEWFTDGASGYNTSMVPEVLHVLDAVRRYPSRKRCAMLAWEALEACLEEMQ